MTGVGGDGQVTLTEGWYNDTHEVINELGKGVIIVTLGLTDGRMSMGPILSSVTLSERNRLYPFFSSFFPIG